jgi:zinc transport system substrate-binding protein
LPQHYFVDKIGGGQVDVEVMVSPGASPATYEPSPLQMRKLGQAKAYFSIGVPFENAWLDKLSSMNPDMSVFETQKGIDKRPMPTHRHLQAFTGSKKHEDGEQSHGHKQMQQKKHGILDPHIWLAPELVKVQARNIRDGLVSIDPENRTVYDSNLKRFLGEIENLDDKIKDIFKKMPEEKRKFMVFHPAWGYFADEYGLQQIPVEAEGKRPGPKQVAEIVNFGRKFGLSVLFVQPQFSKKSARVIASEMGARVVSLNPLAKDWADNLLQAAQIFERAME